MSGWDTRIAIGPTRLDALVMCWCQPGNDLQSEAGRSENGGALAKPLTCALWSMPASRPLSVHPPPGVREECPGSANVFSRNSYVTSDDLLESHDISTPVRATSYARVFGTDVDSENSVSLQ